MPQVKYDVKINNPFVLTAFDKQLIDDNKPGGSDDWTKSIFKDLKERIKDHYSIVQDDFCPYCGTKIAFDGYGEPIEHIVAKDEKPEWMFEPRNLVLSCYECNTKKGTEIVFIDGCYTNATYPTDGTCIKILHPHFDIYLEHIEIVKDIFIKARNDGKGLNTINVFKLFRLGLPMKKAHSLNIESRVEAIAMECLRDPGTPQYLREHCDEVISRIIQRYIAKVALGINTAMP